MTALENVDSQTVDIMIEGVEELQSGLKGSTVLEGCNTKAAQRAAFKYGEPYGTNLEQIVDGLRKLAT